MPDGFDNRIAFESFQSLKRHDRRDRRLYENAKHAFEQKPLSALPSSSSGALELHLLILLRTHTPFVGAVEREYDERFNAEPIS